MTTRTKQALLAGLRKLARAKETPPKIRIRACEQLMELERLLELEPTNEKYTNHKRIKELIESNAA